MQIRHMGRHVKRNKGILTIYHTIACYLPNWITTAVVKIFGNIAQLSILWIACKNWDDK